MFTGLISFVFKISIHGKILKLYGTKDFLKSIEKGDSIAINGICLTVTHILENYCCFEISEETISKTNILLQNNKNVNVELSLQYGDKIGGHLVSGHVHQTGKIISISPDGNCWIDLQKYNSQIKYKGSIAINGVSLTIAEIRNTKIRIALIPETIKRTTFSELKENDMINIEFDINEIENKDDNYWMRLALKEAEKGRKTTAPNPWVGCVIVKNDEIISMGYHEKAGEDHAEVMTFKNCKTPELISGSTLYCTLEPCCHHESSCYPNPCIHEKECPVGLRSPSCSEAIISHKIKKVVIGIIDPDKRVSGKGLNKLKEGGIEVSLISKEVEKEIRYSLRHYIYQRITGLPYVTVKIALTVDGCYKSEDTKWITHLESRNELYDLWEESQAIVLGANTVQKDDPELNSLDFPEGEERNFNFKKIVFDGKCLTNTKAKIFKKDTYIVTKDLDKWKNIECNKLTTTNIHDFLKTVDVMHVLVEGGGKLQKSFFNSGYVNEIIIFRGSKIFGKKGYKWDIPNLNISLIETKLIEYNGENNIMERYIVNTETGVEKEEYNFDNVEKAIENFKRGEMVLVVDDESRENEGDLIVAASKITETQMTEMINVTTGIICVPMEKSRIKKLNLLPMVNNNTDPNNTAFTVSVDYKNVGTGVSSKDRLATVHALADENTLPNDLRRPGHIFPLTGNPKGLEARQGHTEASLALCKLADIYPRVTVIGELKNIDGSMKNRDDCFKYAKCNNIPIITVEQLAKISTNKLKVLSKCDLKSEIGDLEWQFLCFDSGNLYLPHKVLIYGNINDEIIPVRIHSECFTGDVLKSQLCDCGKQLESSMKYIVNEGKGIIIFPSGHEGRGIGIVEKIKAYKLQKEFKNTTFQANQNLGHDIDARTYDDVYKILKILKINKINLLTENPKKITALKELIAENTPVFTQISKYNYKYLQDKRSLFEKHKPEIQIFEKSDKKVAIVYSMWHEKYITQIRNILKEHLTKFGIKNIQEYEAPGSNEIPFVASKISNKVDGIICVGILIKGDTLHFENVSTAVSNGIMQSQIMSGKPTMNCILSCLNFDQVIERINGDKSTLEYIVKGLIKVMKF